MNKIVLFFILQLIHSSDQSDDKGRLSTVMDCLKAIETDGLKSYNKTEYFKEVANFHAKNILNKFLMLNDTVNSTSSVSADFYPYLRYRNSILNRVFTSALDIGISIMIISTDCKSTNIYRLKVDLRNYFTLCESLNASNFHPKKIFSSFQSLRVGMIILLLPRMFIQIYLEMAAEFNRDIFHYITVDYIPDAIRQIQLINPLLKISNLYLIDSPGVLNYGSTNKDNREECSITNEKIHFNDGNEVLSCHYQSQRIIRIVTVFFPYLVVRVPNSFRTENKCEVGLPCKIRSKDSTTTWSWLCCAGKFIDKLSAIMRNIQHPFIIYIVEDGEYGTLKNGSWDGLVDDLYQGKADIAVAAMTFTTERYKYIDYIHELAVEIPIAFLLRRSKVELEILNFSFLPRNTEIWICFLVLLHLAVIFIVYGFECIAYQQNYGQKYSFKDSMSFIGAILFQRDLGGSATRRWPGRLLAITYAFLMTVLISTYTATLTAENVSYEDSPPFYGLRDKMFKDSVKRVGLWLGGISERLVDKYNHKSKRFSVLDYELAAKHLVERKLDAVIGPYNALETVLRINNYCNELVLHVDEIEYQYLSWGCQKNSNICNLFSSSILQLIEKKDFDKIDEKWIPVNSCVRKSATRYPWQYAGGLVICLAVATGICVVILMMEKCCSSLKWRKRRSYKINNED